VSFLRLFFVFLLITQQIAANGVADIQSLRKRYYAAVNSAKITDKLYEELQSASVKPAIVQAYIGSLEALKAKHAYNPYSKLQYLKQADQSMRQAVKADPDNIEIRFLRFSYQYYVPEFLGYSTHKEVDVQVIVKELLAGNFPPADKALMKQIVGFLEETKSVSPAVLQALQNRLNA
jgi:hypothetical protein